MKPEFRRGVKVKNRLSISMAPCGTAALIKLDGCIPLKNSVTASFFTNCLFAGLAKRRKRTHELSLLMVSLRQNNGGWQWKRIDRLRCWRLIFRVFQTQPDNHNLLIRVAIYQTLCS